MCTVVVLVHGGSRMKNEIISNVDTCIFSFAQKFSHMYYVVICRKKRQLPQNKIDTFMVAEVYDSGVSQNNYNASSKIREKVKI